MKKKVLLVGILFLICMDLWACDKNNDEIIGYWMNEKTDTISFSDKENCSINDESYTYKIYDENHLQFIFSDGTVQEYIFKIEEGKLYLKKVGSDSFDEFTKDENEQQEIIKKAEQEEREREAEAAKQEKIEEIQVQIDEYKTLIDDANWRIANNQSDIEKWEQDIQDRKDECEESIAFGDDKEYQEKQRDEFIAVDQEAIQGCENRIAELEEEISNYESEIERLQKQIKEISN